MREAELTVERGAFDDRLAGAIATLSTQALDANSARFLELADARLSGHVQPLKESLRAHGRSCGASSASGRRHTGG